MTATEHTDSPLERARAKRARLAEQTTTDIDVHGYGGELVVKYRLLDPLVEGKEIGNRVASEWAKHPDEQRYYALVDSMIAACAGVYLRVDGKLEPIDPEGSEPILFDGRLAEGLGFEADTARKTVLGVFAGNRAAVVAHAMLLQRWFGDTTGELEATIG